MHSTTSGSSILLSKSLGRNAEELFTNRDHDGLLDVVIFSHCLENILELNKALTTVRRMLADDGHLYIDTPNLYWSGGMNPYHPVVFSPDTLRALLNKHGFKIIRINADDKPSDLITAFLKSHQPWFNLVAVKGKSEIPQARSAAAEVRNSFQMSRRVMGFQKKVKHLRHAVRRQVGI